MMENLNFTWLEIFFNLLFSTGLLGGAIYLLLTRNILYGAYGLLVSLISLAGLYILLGAEFVAVSQIMIYIGGVLVLIVFGIMLTARGKKMNEGLKVVNINLLLSVLLSVVLLGGLSIMILHFYPLDFSLSTETVQRNGQIKAMGLNLMSTQVLMLEVIGVFLLLILIGATYIAKR